MPVKVVQDITLYDIIVKHTITYFYRFMSVGNHNILMYDCFAGGITVSTG